MEQEVAVIIAESEASIREGNGPTGGYLPDSIDEIGWTDQPQQVIVMFNLPI